MQIKDLILNDGTSNVTYSVTSTQAGTSVPAAWKNGTSAINAFRFDMITQRVKGQRRSKCNIRFVRPVVQSIDGVETLIDTATFALTCTLPDVLTSEDRNKLLRSFASLLDTDIVNSLVVNDSPAY